MARRTIALAAAVLLAPVLTTGISGAEPDGAPAAGPELRADPVGLET